MRIYAFLLMVAALLAPAQWNFIFASSNDRLICSLEQLELAAFRA